MPLVIGVDSTTIPDFELELVEQFQGRHLTLRLNKNDQMIGEILVWTINYCESFQRFEYRSTLDFAHRIICGEEHEYYRTLPEDATICICLLEALLYGHLRYVSRTPIPYESEGEFLLLEKL